MLFAFYFYQVASIPATSVKALILISECLLLNKRIPLILSISLCMSHLPSLLRSMPLHFQWSMHLLQPHASQLKVIGAMHPVLPMSKHCFDFQRLPGSCYGLLADVSEQFDSSWSPNDWLVFMDDFIDYLDKQLYNINAIPSIALHWWSSKSVHSSQIECSHTSQLGLCDWCPVGQFCTFQELICEIQ